MTEVPPGLPATMSDRAAVESRDVCELLELLDDAMFAAIGGDRGQASVARTLWLQAVASVGPELVNESRAEYLRYAADMKRLLDRGEANDATRTAIIVELVELLMAG